MYERDAYRSASFCERDLALSRQSRNVRPSERSQKRDRRTGSSSSYLTLRRERARTRPSLYAIDRYLLDNGAVHGALIPVGTWHLEHVRNRCYGPGGASNTPDQVTVGSGRHYVAILRAYTQLWYSNLFFLFPPFQKTKHELSRHAHVRPKCHFALDLSPCVFASPLACTRFYSEIAPNILLGRITPRAKYFRACTFHAEVSLKKYLADFGIIKIFEYSLYPNYNESYL